MTIRVSGGVATLYKPRGLAESALGARQAIPHWPRGKSTVAPIVWSFGHTPEYQLDLFYDQIYHEEQQRMIDRWIENYRNPYYKEKTIIVNLR